MSHSCQRQFADCHKSFRSNGWFWCNFRLVIMCFKHFKPIIKFFEYSDTQRIQNEYTTTQLIQIPHIRWSFQKVANFSGKDRHLLKRRKRPVNEKHWVSDNVFTQMAHYIAYWNEFSSTQLIQNEYTTTQHIQMLFIQK